MKKKQAQKTRVRQVKHPFNWNGVVMVIGLMGIVVAVVLVNRGTDLYPLAKSTGSSLRGFSTCPTSSSESYGVGSIPDPDPNAHSNPDTVLSLKGWEPFAGDLSLVTYGYPQGEPPDPKAPQLGSMLNNGPQFRTLYQIRNYDPANYNNPPHLAGLSSQVGQIVLAPDNGYDIGGGYQYKVIYASSNELTVNVMGDEYAIDGYAMHIIDFCVDPNLVALYTKLNNEGRRFLPTVKKGQRIGTASGPEVKVAIRDSGSYMDPRSKLDWWQKYEDGGLPTVVMPTKVKKKKPTSTPTMFIKPTRVPKDKPTPTSPAPTLAATLSPTVSANDDKYTQPTERPDIRVPTIEQGMVPIVEEILPTKSPRFQVPIQVTGFFSSSWTFLQQILTSIAP